MGPNCRGILLRLRREEDGQAIVFVALILLTLVSFVAVTINIGNFVTAKIRMQNVVDAAALNGAIWEARGFNMIEALNAVVFAAEWTVFSEIMEAAYWCFWAALCLCIYCPYECFKCAWETADAVWEYFDVLNDIDKINTLQSNIAEYAAPATVTAAWVYELGMNPYNESSWFYILPGLYYLSGSVKFNQTPWGGQWYDLFLGKLACNATGSGYLYPDRIYYQTTGDYPQDQWLFYFAYREEAEAPMLQSWFDSGGVGYFVITQARPYAKSSGSWLHYHNLFYGSTWDAKLMPITIDNLLWSELFSWFPPLQWLFSAITDLILLH